MNAPVVSRDECFSRACTRCKVEKPLTSEHFTPRPDRRSGFRSMCRACKRKAKPVLASPDNQTQKEAIGWFALLQSRLPSGVTFTCDEIGELVGLTGARVRQIESAAIHKLERYFKTAAGRKILREMR